MADHYTGQNGTLTVGGTAVGQLTSISVDTTVSTVETTVMGDNSKTFLPSLREWSASASITFNETDQATIDGVITGAVPVAFVAYPSTSAGGEPKMTGNVIVTGFSMSSSTDAVVTGEISMQGDGDLVFTTA